MLIVLMIGFMKPVDLTTGDHEFEVLEFYAGAARLAKLCKSLGGSAAAMDKDYDKEGNNRTKNNAMDFNTSAGFTPLTCNPAICFFQCLT